MYTNVSSLQSFLAYSRKRTFCPGEQAKAVFSALDFALTIHIVVILLDNYNNDTIQYALQLVIDLEVDYYVLIDFQFSINVYLA